ncbi:hypothetical protein CCACVL1_30235 [Corchorus capsularis]|uniref:Uncharacterized protein n=1 Tax=Corchorus capsularis TaxID=210143 RepID=A0A1R3FYA9_COCAP|nr:hypothetical protein CCACVL1_30235 [Corchorus capsularis]
MEEIKHPSPPRNTSTTTATATANGQQETSAMCRIKKEILVFGVSLRKGYRYVKAYFVGLVRRLRARTEEEATAAELLKQKMQVDASDEAERAKEKIYRSM